jgi:hypothetical protein
VRAHKRKQKPCWRESYENINHKSVDDLTFYSNENTFSWLEYVFDPADGEARVWFGYPSKEEIIWLPKQLQEICMNFYIQNLRMSMSEAFFTS